MPDLTITRRHFSTAVLGAAASVAGVSAPVVAQVSVRTHADWFRHAESVTQTWHVEPVPGDPLEVRIRPRAPAAGGPSYRILVVYPRPSSAYDVAITTILTAFEQKSLDATFTVVNFLNQAARGRAVVARAERERFDLILTMGSEATAFLWETYRGGAIPVVTVCSKDPVLLAQAEGYDRGSGTNFAFTSLNVPIDVQMAYVSALKPNLRNVAILADAANISAIETQMKPLADFARPRGVGVLELLLTDPRRARAEIAELVAGGVREMARTDPSLRSSLFWVTGSTSVFREIATINAHAGRVAVLSAVPDIVQGGDDSAALSIGISFESNAQVAALYAGDILRGRADVSRLKVGLVTPPDIAINFRRVRHSGMRVPLAMFEAAGTIYDHEGRIARLDGKSVRTRQR